jgi:ribosomal protein S18 acetylase RimI-like enzyme
MGLWPQAGVAAWHRGILVAVWLEPEWRGYGRAEAMLEEIVAIARERGILQIELNVHAGNVRAARFYAQNGFSPYGQLPRAFRADDGFADDVLMVRMLDA